MAAGAEDFGSFRLSTRALPERERIPMYREVFGRGLLHIEVEPLSDYPIHAEATLRALPGLRTVACIGSAMRLQRTRSNIADGDNSIGLVVNLGERGQVCQRGRDVALEDGDAVLLLHAEPATVTYAHGYLGLVVPRSALAARVRNIDDTTMRLIPHDTEALRLLVDHLRLVREELVLATPKLRRAVVTHVHHLVALALGPQRANGEDGASAMRAARLAAILDHIAAHFQEPELDVAAVANSQGISPRHLHRLIEATGTSFTARVNELRLQRAFALLTEARDGARRISEVALRVGFSDISHFNRLFRARFGDTPSGVRGQCRRALQGEQ